MTLFEDDVKSLTFRNKTVKSMVRTRDNAIIYQMIPDVDYMTVIVQNLEQAPAIIPYNHYYAFYPSQDITIDYGDGTIKQYDDGHNDGDDGTFSHNYNNPGTYTVKIYGITKLDGGEDEFDHTYHGAPFGDIDDIISIIVPSNVTSLGKSAFSGCTGLTSVTIPNNITELGDGCFNWCKGLSSITIPSQITKLGESCFEECDSLISVTLPNGITELEDRCFYQCINLPSLVIPNGVTRLGNECFYQCNSLQSISIPNTVTELGEGCFSECSSLQSLSLPNTVTELGEECFNKCSNLTSLILSSNITTIPEACFCEDSSLVRLNIPQSVSSIENRCFEDTNLQDMTFNWDNANDILEYGNGWGLSYYNGPDIFIPYGTTQLYIDAFYPEDSLIEKDPIITKSVQIIWNDNNNANNQRPNSVNIELRQNNNQYLSFNLAESNGWMRVVSDLPYKVNNTIADYTWLPSSVSQYEIESAITSNDLTTITYKFSDRPTPPL